MTGEIGGRAKGDACGCMIVWGGLDRADLALGACPFSAVFKPFPRGPVAVGMAVRLIRGAACEGAAPTPVGLVRLPLGLGRVG